jgi:serine/threonine protein kinase
MPVASGFSNVAEKYLRHACAELDRHLRAGQPCRVETFFAANPLLTCHEDSALELIYTEFATREELGQRPTVEEFVARFPHWKEHLERQFAIHELLCDRSTGGEPPAELDALADPDVARERSHARHWLGSYELLAEIARGGCGMVYKAWQHGLDRLCAVKVLRPEFGCLLPARERFCQEAKVMAALRHPAIMPIHEIGESNGVIYFSMDFIPGGSLAQRLAAGAEEKGETEAIPWYDGRAAAELVERVARAIHYAHQQQVIHRDLKPSNILLDGLGHPLVSDFGLAQLPTAETALEGPDQIVGTPAYMAPEQVDGGRQPVTPATDVWALGVILYELLTGRRPFPADSLDALKHQICFQPVEPVSRAVGSLDAGLSAICLKCLAKEPGRRYQTAQDLAEDLHRLVQNRISKP